MSGCCAARRDLDGADDFWDVVDVDGCGSGGVQAGEEAVEIGWAALGCGTLAEAFALAGLLGRRGEEAVDESAEVEAGAPSDDGKAAALSDAGEGFASLAAVVASGAGLRRARRCRSCGAGRARAPHARAWRCRSPSRGRRRPSRS